MSPDDRMALDSCECVETSAEDVRTTFVVTQTAEREYTNWKDRQDRARVCPAVEGHVTRALYQATPEDIRQVCHDTKHALGDVKKRDIIGVSAIENWNPDFAFTHLFHFLVEHLGRIPTWQEFCGFHLHSERGRWLLGDQIIDQYEKVIVESGHSRQVVWDALHWRVGNAYYGILRDVYAVVGLRARDIDVRSHPLADALFRVDAWVDRTVLSLRVRNPRYRSGMEGRKIPAERLLHGARPEFDFHAIELRAATQFGEVHLPDEKDLDAVAKELLARSGGQ